MFKFLIYLFLFYIVFRLLFGRLTGGFRGGSFYVNPNRKNEPKQQEQEGSVTINPKLKETKGNNDTKIGDYVDYEEIK